MPTATAEAPVVIEPIRHDADILPVAYEERKIDQPLTFEIVDGTGDTKLIWDKTRTEEVDNARQTFERLTKKGYRAFRVVGKEGTKGEQMEGFDADAERVILAPAMKGG